MSRVFRRPMFRGGSTNMNGIMSGIEDRENYAEGTASERYKKVFDQYSKPAMDPLSKLLIQGGLRGLSETRGGGTLANMALAFEKPTEQLMSDLQQRKNDERDMALAGLGMDIKDERSREARMQAVEDIKTKQDFEMNKLNKSIQAQINLENIKSQNKKITAQKEARVMLGPDATDEEINTKAAEILQQRVFGVENRFQQKAKKDQLAYYENSYGLTGTAAEEYYEFENNRGIIEEATGKPVRTFIKGQRNRRGQVDYTQKAKNKSDGIYIDPINGNYIDLRNGVPTIIDNPLDNPFLDKKSVSNLPGIEEEVIEDINEINLPGRNNNPLMNIG